MNRFNDDFYEEQTKGVPEDMPQFRHNFGSDTIRPTVQPDKGPRQPPRDYHEPSMDMLSMEEILNIIQKQANGQPFVKVAALLSALNNR